MKNSNTGKHHLFQKFASLFLSSAILASTLSLTAFASDPAVIIKPTVPPSSSEETTIKIFHTNDVHSRYDAAIAEDGTLESFGYARLKTLIQQNKNPGEQVLLLDAGDVYHGQPFATLNRGDSIAQLMRAVGYDAVTPGNHDFNYGFTRTPELARRSYVDLLAANVKRANDQSPSGFKDYKIYEYGDVKVGVFGLCTPETRYKTNPDNVRTLRFLDPSETAESMVEQLRENEKVDVVVCLAHLGNDIDSKGNRSIDVAANVDGIDLIIDGHSHSEADTYTPVNDTVITSAGQYLENVGMATITVDANKNVEVETQNIKASDYNADKLAPNAGVQAVIETIKEEQEPILNEIVTSTPILLNGERADCRTSETNLARLITSSMINETGADVALTNGGGIRASIEQGPISVGDIQTVLPFGNYIVTVSLTGEQLKQAIENGLPGVDGEGLEVIGKKIQVAGIQVTYDPAKPAGSRIVSITKDGKEIEDNATFVVATNDFMQTGGDEYTSLHQPIQNEFSALDEALIRYLEKIGTAGIKTIDEEPARVQVKKSSSSENVTATVVATPVDSIPATPLTPADEVATTTESSVPLTALVPSTPAVPKV